MNLSKLVSLFSVILSRIYILVIVWEIGWEIEACESIFCKVLAAGDLLKKLIYIPSDLLYHIDLIKTA